jgi:uncharacterized protein YdeI (YjbR/CyaY-like superfamily)
MKTKKEDIDQILLFSTPAARAVWLGRNHRSSSGLWLRLARKGSDLRSVTCGKALEIALCYGWIDGQRRGENQLALDMSPQAKKFFIQLDAANRYAILFRIQTVKKAETRERKVREFVGMLERNERIHQPRGAVQKSK